MSSRSLRLHADSRRWVVAAGLAQGPEICGAFHSHPGGIAVPSIHDRAAAVADWWLVVTACGEVRAWSPVPGGFDEAHVDTAPI